MKTMHIHVGVEDIAQSVKFYGALFGAQPTKLQPDYAKWLLDDPHINFTISTRVQKSGIDHLGIQVDSGEELAEMRQRIKQADLSVYDEGETVCCYARSDKSWVQDPAGIAWESYRSMQDVAVFSEKSANDNASCCVADQNQPVTTAIKIKKTGCC